MNEMTIPGRQIGRSLPRLEARDKVTGRTEYVHNLRLPGMLYGKIFRSTVAHGRIRNIDVSAAQAHAGVAHVITGEDVRKVMTSPSWRSIRSTMWASRLLWCSRRIPTLRKKRSS